jgi:hypothetical protein
MAELVVYNHCQITLVHVRLDGKVLIAKNRITVQIILVEATVDVFPPDMLTVANVMKVLMVLTVKLIKMNVINGIFARIMVNVSIPTDLISKYFSLHDIYVQKLEYLHCLIYSFYFTCNEAPKLQMFF